MHMAFIYIMQKTLHMQVYFNDMMSWEFLREFSELKWIAFD